MGSEELQSTIKHENLHVMRGCHHVRKHLPQVPPLVQVVQRFCTRHIEDERSTPSDQDALEEHKNEEKHVVSLSLELHSHYFC